MSFLCHSYAIRMSFVCQTYVLLCYSYVIQMLPECIRMSFVCYSYVLVFIVNLYYMQILSVNEHSTVLVQVELSNDFQLIIFFLVLRMCRNHLHLTIKLDFDKIWAGSFPIVSKCITGRCLVKFRFWEWVWYSQCKKNRKETLVSSTANSKPFLFLGFGAKRFFEKVTLLRE